MSAKPSTKGAKHLEITMRDVLDGLEEAAIYINYHSEPGTIEILSIEPPGRPIQLAAEIIKLEKQHPIFTEGKRSSNIVEYLIQRELKRSA